MFRKTKKLTTKAAFTLAESSQKRHVIAHNEKEIMSLRSGTVGCCPQPITCAISQCGVVAFDGRRSRKPRRGTSEARDEQQSTEMLNFRCCCERCRLMRGADGSVRSGNDMKVRKAAFTLAETLIALAVIGIVAALTIPGIVKNYNQKAWGHAQDVFAKKLDVALKEMNTEGTLTGYRTTEAFVNELKKNIKITKICAGSQITNCFADKVVWSQWDAPVEVNENNLKYNPMYGYDWAETVGVQFSNGVNALIGYNKNCASDPYNNQYSPSASCIGIIYDVSGFKKPNSNGKDIASNGNLTLGCAFKFTYGGQSVCFTRILEPNTGYSPLPMTKAGGKTIKCSNVKDALGISGCYYGEGNNTDKDYWAGAAYACGGTTKMASLEQLSLLAKYLYNTNTLSNTQGSLTMQENRLGPFSAYYTTHTGRWLTTSTYENYFSVWGGAERSDSDAYYSMYLSTYELDNFYAWRGRTFEFAVCVD